MARRDEAKKPTTKQIKDRYEAAGRKWDEWRGVMDLCYQFAAPQRNLFGGQFEGNVQGGTKMNLVFDSTAISSLDRFANRVQSNVFPPQKKWARLECGTAIREEVRPQVQKGLEVVNDQMFAVMRSSNFDIAIGEFLHDIGIGTACMCIQPGDAASPVNYTAVSPAIVRFEEDEFGRPCNVYRPLRVKAEMIKRLWKGATLDDALTEIVRDKPTDEVDLLESTIKDLDTGRYHYQISYMKGEHEVYWQSRKYSNWVISRYSKLAGEIIGRGPVVSALPDIRSLNKAKELLLKKAAFELAGVFTVIDDGVINTNNLKIVPNMVIGVAANAGARGPTLQRLDTGSSFNLSQIVLNDLVMSIKRILLDESLPPDTASARSATEIIERMKELAQNMGSAFGRLIDEVLIPIVEITLQVLAERGVIVFPLKLDGREVKAVPVAPLAMAQHMDEVETIFNYAQMMALLGPEGMVALNPTETIDRVGDMMGVPAAVRFDRDERVEEMKKNAEQQAQALAQQTAAEFASKQKLPNAPAAAPMGLELAA